MPISGSDTPSGFLQFGRLSKFVSICDISLQDLFSNCISFCNRVPHFLHAYLTKMEGSNLTSRVLTTDAISEVNQYGFDIEEISVTPKYFKLPNFEYEHKVIYGLEEMSNHFKLVNISTDTYIQEILSMVPRQERIKSMKLSLIVNPILSPSNPKIISQNKDPPLTPPENDTVKFSHKFQLKVSVKAFKLSSLYIPYFVVGLFP